MKSTKNIAKGSYWNHNAAYHRWIIKRLGQNCGRVLDVGCGEGLLVQKLASFTEQVIGIDPDPKTIERAKSRLSDTPNALVECVDFIKYSAVPESFDAIVFVASLHHMDAETALRRAGELLAPNGKVLIVGCAKNGKLTDWLIDIGRTPFAWIGTKLHGETNPGVVTHNPTVTFDEMRSLAKTVFAKVKIRRGLYYRYLLIGENR